MQATTERRQGLASHLGTNMSDTSSSQGSNGCHLVKQLCLQKLQGGPMELGFKTASRAGASVIVNPLNHPSFTSTQVVPKDML